MSESSRDRTLWSRDDSVAGVAENSLRIFVAGDDFCYEMGRLEIPDGPPLIPSQNSVARDEFCYEMNWSQNLRRQFGT